jgi:signal transduction histidine kinase
MKRLLDDLLDVSRVSQGKIELRKQRVELATLLLQAVEVSRPMMIEKRQQLAMTLCHGAHPAGRRSHPHRAGVREPGEQRRQVHAARRPHHARVVGRGRRSCREGS